MNALGSMYMRLLLSISLKPVCSAYNYSLKLLHCDRKCNSKFSFKNKMKNFYSLVTLWIPA